jgi:hypothetical protein
MISAVMLLTLAKCASPVRACGCGSQWAVIGEVTAAEDGGFVVRGGMPFGPAPAEVPVGSPPGTRVLVHELELPLIVDANAQVSCAGATVDSVKLASSIADGTCVATLEAAGYRQPPCHDNGIWLACGCSSSVTNLSLALLLTLAIRSRKQSAR